MGKRGGNHKGHGSTSGMTMREEKSGKKLSRGSSVSVRSKSKLEHLQNLALWAGREPSMPSLAAFFGYRFAECSEANGIPPDPCLFPCQRCETLLQPGYNCTVRIEKNESKSRKRNKRNEPLRNNLVYKCNFCLHRNIKRGTPKGHMKDICPLKPPQRVESRGDGLGVPQFADVLASCSENELKINPLVENASSPEMPGNDLRVANTPADHDFTDRESCTTKEVEVTYGIDLDLAAKSPADDEKGQATPVVTPRTTLLEVKKRKRNKSSSKKVTESESNSTNAAGGEKDTSGLSKRKRKSWTSLKDMSTEHGLKQQKVKGLSIFMVNMLHTDKLYHV